MCVYSERRGWIRQMKRKSVPRVQKVETPTKRRALIGCLETIASGRGISMHEICRQREKKKKRDHSNISKSVVIVSILNHMYLKLTKPHLWNSSSSANISTGLYRFI